MELSAFLLRLGCAVLAGSVIGFERQWHQKNAGLRTNALVALGAAIYVVISIQMTGSTGDVTRIIGQVVVGVGFLGGGVILHKGVDVSGLTTAATIWCSSAIGCLAAGGFYLETAICTFGIIIINTVLLRIDIWLKNRP